MLNMARRQVDDAIQHMAIYAHIYDDLAKHGRGAKTSEDLWNARIAIARERNSPLMIESLTRKLSRVQRRTFAQPVRLTPSSAPAALSPRRPGYGGSDEAG